MLFYAPKWVEPKEISTLCSQIDIAPTILGILNMNYESCFFGKDVLRDPPKRAFISNYQKVAYLKDNHLTILKPIKDVAFLDLNEDKSPLVDQEKHLKEAVSFFQTASHWREYNRFRTDRSVE